MRKKLPRFKSAEAEALFWEKHDIFEYVDPNEFEIVGSQKSTLQLFSTPLKQKKILFSMRLEQDLLQRIKHLAQKKKINYQTMLRQWIADDYEVEKNK